MLSPMFSCPANLELTKSPFLLVQVYYKALSMITCPIQNQQYRCSSVVINHDFICCHYRKLRRLIVFVVSFRMVLFVPLETCVSSITLRRMVLLSMEYKVKRNPIFFTFYNYYDSYGNVFLSINILQIRLFYTMSSS